MKSGFYLSPDGTQIIELVVFCKFKERGGYFVKLFDGTETRFGLIYEPANLLGLELLE